MTYESFTNMRELVRGFAGAMDLVAPDVQDHHQQVAYLSYRLAEAMELSEADRLRAIYGALLHDIGSIVLEQSITLEDVERNAPKLARAGGDILRMSPRTRPLSDIVANSQVSWRSVAKLPKKLYAPYLIGQIIHLADGVSLAMGSDRSVLNQVEYIGRCIESSALGEYHPDVLEAFREISGREYVWMDLQYQPERFLEFVPEEEISIDGTLRFTELMSMIIDFRSPFTAMHSAGVAASAVYLAGQLGMSQNECKMMRIAGYLHDLGKLKIPKEILEKPGKLTDEEFNVIKEHAYYTYILLKDIRGFGQIAQWAAYHHEKINRHGYPFGLSGENIPFGARILAVSDVFSAITEERPYRKGMEKEKVISILRENVESGALSGSIVELLIDHYDEIDAARDRESREAGRRYFRSIRQKE